MTTGAEYAALRLREKQEKTQARLARALTLLREVEWADGEDGLPNYCLFCNMREEDTFDNVLTRYKIRDAGHAPDCKLAALLEEE